MGYIPFGEWLLVAAVCYPCGVSKNPHAVALGRLGGNATAAALSDEEKSEIGRNAGLAGGPARAASLTEKRRSEIATQAAKARWGKRKKKK